MATITITHGDDLTFQRLPVYRAKSGLGYKVRPVFALSSTRLPRGFTSKKEVLSDIIRTSRFHVHRPHEGTLTYGAITGVCRGIDLKGDGGLDHILTNLPKPRSGHPYTIEVKV